MSVLFYSVRCNVSSSRCGWVWRSPLPQSQRSASMKVYSKRGTIIGVSPLHLSIQPLPFKTCRISFNYLRSAILNNSLHCSTLVMSCLTTWDVSLIFLNVHNFSLKVSWHHWTASLFWTLRSFLVTKFTLVSGSVIQMTVSWSLLESKYCRASLKQSPMKSLMLLLKYFQLWFQLLINEARAWKSKVVFLLMKAWPLICSCMMFKYFNMIPNSSPAIILCSQVALAFLYTAHKSVVGTDGPCFSMCSATAIVPSWDGKICRVWKVKFLFVRSGIFLRCTCNKITPPTL